MAGRFQVQGFRVLAVPFFFITDQSIVYRYLNHLAWPLNRHCILDFVKEFDFDVIQAHYINIDGTLVGAISKNCGKPDVVSTQREERRFRNRIDATLLVRSLLMRRRFRA